MDGPLPHADIARLTVPTPAAVSRISRDPIDAGLIRELDAPPPGPDQRQANGPGKPFAQRDVDPSGGAVLGIGVNLLSQSVTLADLNSRPWLC